MTAQFAKVLVRFVGLVFLPTLACEISVGPNQFAYIKQRGARDALAYLFLSWLAALREIEYCLVHVRCLRRFRLCVLQTAPC